MLYVDLVHGSTLFTNAATPAIYANKITIFILEYVKTGPRNSKTYNTSWMETFSSPVEALVNPSHYKTRGQKLGGICSLCGERGMRSMCRKGWYIIAERL